MLDHAATGPKPKLLRRNGRPIDGRPWRITGQLRDGWNISGIASGEQGRGVIVTDEGSRVQSFRLARDTCTLELEKPDVRLLRRGEEADLESVCWDGEWFYAVGSHALGRQTPDHQPSRHHVYRLRFGAEGKIEHEASHALGPLLENDGVLGGRYRKPLDALERGVDVEGIAVRRGRLLFGLRSPSLAAHCFVLSIRVEVLFGSARSRLRSPERYALPLGDGVGIRDLVALADGVVLLSGPSTNDDRAPFALWWWDDEGDLALLATFTDTGEAKAEGLLVLDATRDELDLLVVFDSAERGGPYQFRVPRAG